MRSRVLTWAFLAAFTAFATTASATTINFSGYTQPTGGTLGAVPLGKSIVVDGFVFTSSMDDSLSVFSLGSPYHPSPKDPTTTSLTEYFAGGVTTISRESGAAFALDAIDLAGWGYVDMGTPWTFDVTFTGVKAGGLGTVTQTFKVNDQYLASSLQTFAFGSDFRNLISVSAKQGVARDGQAFQFDNLLVDDREPSPVPEPASLLLLGTGLVGLRAWRKRR